MSRKLNLCMEYPYAYETHLHTNKASACGRSTPEEMAYACKEAGYTGIFVTEHFFYGNTSIDRELSWKEWVQGYCQSYELAKRTGDEIGLQVFFGWEASYQGTDFLVYGLDQEWLIAHPQIRDASIEEQYALVHADGGMVIHAHPFREEFYIPEIRLFPEYVDGVETLNASHVPKYGPQVGGSFDRQAEAYAQKYNFPQTAGSDIHSVDLLGGGMAFQNKLNNIQDYMQAVKNRSGMLLPLDPAFFTE
ncbi:MAG TPA: PHP domain-containing protein [Lachnospiraceae bacterium]|nr:PHP domain-containing protein [Lachnospiraceae bacterium]